MISLTQAAAELFAEAETIRPELARIVRVTVFGAAEIAKEMFGNKQPDWEPLSDATIRQKSKLGFGPLDYSPLLRTGETRESIRAEASGLEGRVFSTDPIFRFSEMGTVNEPPRPVLPTAMAIAGETATELLIDLAETLR